MKVKGSAATVAVTCKGATSCQVSLGLTVKETLIGKRIIKVSAGKPSGKRRHKLVRLGGATATVGAGKTARIKVKLNRTGRGLLSKRASPQGQAHGDPAQWRQDGHGRPPHADVHQARQTTPQEVIKS